MKSPQYPITIFYDGACRLCSTLMARYRRLDAQERICFMDISTAGFDAHAFGLDPALVQTYIYAKDARGRIVRGIDTLLWLWLSEGKTFLPHLVGLPIVKPIAKLLYAAVSRMRYVFGRKKDTCQFHCAKRF